MSPLPEIIDLTLTANSGALVPNATIVKPISEMVNYELAECSNGELFYDLDRKELKEKLNSIIKMNKIRELFKK